MTQRQQSQGEQSSHSNVRLQERNGLGSGRQPPGAMPFIRLGLQPPQVLSYPHKGAEDLRKEVKLERRQPETERLGGLPKQSAWSRGPPQTQKQSSFASSPWSQSPSNTNIPQQLEFP